MRFKNFINPDLSLEIIPDLSLGNSEKINLSLSYCYTSMVALPLLSVTLNVILSEVED